MITMDSIVECMLTRRVQVSEQQIRDDLALPKFAWDHPSPISSPRKDGPDGHQVRVFQDPTAACKVRPSFLLAFSLGFSIQIFYLFVIRAYASQDLN